MSSSMSSIRALMVVALSASWAVAGCGGDDEQGDDGGAETPDAAPPLPDSAPPAPDAAPACPPAEDPMEPARLCQTGLYSDVAGDVLAEGVREFEPRFALWSDGASKRRFVALPDDAAIDTADMDFWQLPVGTRLWKEFTRDGVRVETRLLMKTGDDAWFMMAYGWNAEQTEAVAKPLGGANALETEHDIPSQSRCEKCHLRVPDVALGFSAIQLAHDGAGVTLADLVAEGALSAPPAAGDLALPGDATAQAALGYLHANCGNCHNEHSDVMDTVSLQMWLKRDDLGAVESTATYVTGVGQGQQRSVEAATAIIEPGNPAASAVHIRMQDRGAIGMPPIASELVDGDGVAAVDAWITALGQ